MTRKPLPDGIPADNLSTSLSGAIAPVPDVATPAFARSELGQEPAAKGNHQIIIQIEEDDDDDDDKISVEVDDEEDDGIPRPASPPNPLPFLFAAALLMLALGAIIIANNRQPTPRCSEQPTWNQYNCLPG